MTAKNRHAPAQGSDTASHDLAQVTPHHGQVHDDFDAEIDEDDLDDGDLIEAEAPSEPADTLRFITETDAASERLDRVLARAFPDFSRARLQQVIKGGGLLVNGAPVSDASRRVGAGVTLALDVPPALPAEPQGELIPLDVVYEDDQLIVINKEAGIVVHPAGGHHDGTLVNALIAHCGASLSGIGGVKRPGIVHRLDKDTSGLLVVAKTDRAHKALAAQFADHGRTGPLERSYLAIIWGVPRLNEATINAPIERSNRNREKMMVVHEGRGREAITHFNVLERYSGPENEPLASLIACQLETGRTHQIRVHLSHAGYPLLGDPLYGTGFMTKASKLAEKPRAALRALGRQALHAAMLGFAHPLTQETMIFERDPPEDFANLQEALANP